MRITGQKHQVYVYLGDTKDWFNLWGTIEVKIEQVISDVVGNNFIEPVKLYKLYSTGSGKLLHNAMQGNDILHFHMGPYLRGEPGSPMENGLEDGLEGGKFR